MSWPILVEIKTWSEAFGYAMSRAECIKESTVRLRVRAWIKSVMFRVRDKGNPLPTNHDVIVMVNEMTKSIAHRMGVKV